MGLILLKLQGKIILKKSKSGKNLERILFNRCLYRMNLAECLFILNEKNYNKTLEEFREGFNEIKVEDLEIDKEGIFSEFNEIIKFKKNFLLNGLLWLVLIMMRMMIIF